MINNRIGNERPRILVVDDEKDILRIIKRDLESTFVDENNTSEDKFDVETFSNGQDALKAIESHPNNYYDLVLTDIRMPKMNGFEL